MHRLLRLPPPGGGARGGMGASPRCRRADARVREWALRPFAAGLLGGNPASNSMVAFVLLVLATVLYDGFLATPEGTQVERAVTGLSPVPAWLDPLAIRTVWLIGFWALFLGAYMEVCVLMR